MGLETYIAAYCREYPFVPVRTITQEICGAACTMEVLQGEESFIMADVLSVDDLLIFYGCCWACPYFYVIYDPVSGRFLDLWDLYRVAFEETITVQGERILFPYRDGEERKTIAMTIPEIRKLLAEKGTGDM